MRLLTLELRNFRQYGGEQRITFANGTTENVTVLYGTNGAGKTTLLNAFTWVLYEYLSDDVEEKGRLVNDTAWMTAPIGAEVTAGVQLEFEHDGTTYIVERTVSGEKVDHRQNLRKPEMSLRIRDPSGQTRTLDIGQTMINRILPLRLANFFFVNGERIEQLVRPDAYGEIQNAIKTLLGLVALERAKKDLPLAKTKISRKLQPDGTDSVKLASKADQIAKHDADIAGLEAELERLIGDYKHLNDDFERIEQRLLELAGSAKLQGQRKGLENDKALAEAARDRHIEDRMNALRERGFLAFLADLPDRVCSVCDGLREAGSLPAPIKTTFVNDLLKLGVCICGTTLEPGHRPHDALVEWNRRHSDLAEVEDTITRLNGNMSHLTEARATLADDLNKFDIAIAGEEERVRSLKDRINEISALLHADTEESISGLERSRDERVRDMQENRVAQSKVKDDIARDTAERKRLSDEIDNLQVKGEANQRIKARMALVDEVHRVVDEILQSTSEYTRRSLDEKIKEIFEPVSLKDYEPSLAPAFQLELTQVVGGQRMPAPKSTGENMLLSMAFVAAIAAKCREAAERQEQLFPGVGGDFPVVMDAAFGQLDDDYRTQIASFLPNMTSQVIVMTSKAQAAGAVEQMLRPRIGRQYVIAMHTDKTVDKVTETIAINNREYPYQVVSSFNGAEIVEVAR